MWPRYIEVSDSLVKKLTFFLFGFGYLIETISGLAKVINSDDILYGRIYFMIKRISAATASAQEQSTG